MAPQVRPFAAALVALALLAGLSLRVSAEDPLARMARQQEPYTTAVALEFNKKNQNPLMRMLSGVFQPNGYATGVLVGSGLVMTSYHVVSGKLTAQKKHLLSFKPDDELEVDVFVNGCRAKVVGIDPKADLALLQVCAARPKQPPTFRTSPTEDEPLFLIAQPGEQKTIRRGSFTGAYTLGSVTYLSAKIDGQDGFSGSPVYDSNGKIVGIFCLYDWMRGVALLSPAADAQRLLAGYGG